MADEQVHEFFAVPVDEIDTRSLEAGELLYIPTASGSHYLFEVTSKDDDWSYGLLSRRGEPREFTEISHTMTNFDGVPTRLYHSLGLRVGERAFIYTNDKSQLPDNIALSKIAEELQIFKPTSES